MENLKIFAIVAILLALLPNPATAQCDDATMKISSDDTPGSIKSYNLINGGTEYNRTANCSWEFNLQSSQALVLTVKRLRLYYVVRGGKVCSGSYNLTINAEPMKCNEYVDTMNGAPIPYCKAYYNSSSCLGIQDNLQKLNSCKTVDEVFSTVPMTYFSDGRTSPESKTLPMHFKIEYEFIQCPKAPTENSTTPSPFSTAPKNSAVSSNSSSTFSTSFFTSNGGSGEAKGLKSSTVIIIASCAAGVVILFLIVVTIFCIIKRKSKPNGQLPQGERNQSQQEQNQESGTVKDQSTTAKGNLNPDYQSDASPYETVDRIGQSRIARAEVEDAGYAAMGGAIKRNQSERATVGGAFGNDQSTSNMYDTLGGAVETKAPGSEVYDSLNGATASKQPGSEMYSTVGVSIESNQSEIEAYSTMADLQSAAQTTRPPEDHVIKDALYSTVSIKEGGDKVHYNKEMVDNVLYETMNATK